MDVKWQCWSKVLKSISHIHLMGICGTAMASLAGLLKQKGYHVTGSDQNVYPPMSTQLESLGIDIMQGYKKENLVPRPDLVIVGNVIAKRYEEAQALLESDIPYTSLPKAMADFVIEDRNSIVVAGTHGKTTMTSMISWVADQCVEGSGFLVGGIPLNFNQSFKVPTGDWFVIEGDEYDTAFFDKVPKFIHYKPKYVILSSIEFDHADIYNSIDDIKKAFIMLLERIPKEGVLVYNADDKNILSILKHANCKTVGYGQNNGDYQIHNRDFVVGRNQFAVNYQGKNIADIAVKQIGEYNSMNALASFALSLEMGWDKIKVLQALAGFKGVKRRQELIGEPMGIPIYEDFAHHPTAVKLTLKAFRESFKDKKIIAVFEPRSATSRRKIFQNDYAEAFKLSDVVVIAKPFDTSKIPENERFSSEALISSLKQSNQHVYLGESTEQMISMIQSEVDENSVIVIMSNGGFDNIYDKLLQALK